MTLQAEFDKLVAEWQIITRGEWGVVNGIGILRRELSKLTRRRVRRRVEIAVNLEILMPRVIANTVADYAIATGLRNIVTYEYILDDHPAVELFGERVQVRANLQIGDLVFEYVLLALLVRRGYMRQICGAHGWYTCNLNNYMCCTPVSAPEDVAVNNLLDEYCRRAHSQ